jgi:hypothetical protein
MCVCVGGGRVGYVCMYAYTKSNIKNNIHTKRPLAVRIILLLQTITCVGAFHENLPQVTEISNEDDSDQVAR